MDQGSRGWAWPLRVDPRGRGLALVDGAPRVRGRLLLLLGTRPGERLGLPSMGCRVHEVLHAPATEATAARAAHLVREAIGRWEPDVEVEAVDTVADDDGVLRVEVRYRVRGSDHVEVLGLHPDRRTP